MLKKIKNKIFKHKLKKIGFDMSDGSENERLATTLNEKGLGGNHFVKTIGHFCFICRASPAPIIP